MNRLMQTRFEVVFLTAFLLASAQKANAQTLTIQNTTTNQTTLSVSGTNYCALPAVTLGGTSLSVLTATPTFITATLPSLAPGTYYLVVSCGTLAGRTVYSFVTLGLQKAAGGCWVNDQLYADCGNGTVTDSVTGLIWLKDAACAALGTPNFAATNAAARGLHDGQRGLSDGSAAGEWRYSRSRLFQNILPAWCGRGL